MVPSLALVGICLAAITIFIGVWVWLDMPSPARGTRKHPCINGCGAQGYDRIRRDYHSEHKRCKTCGWVHHFNTINSIGTDYNGE